MRSKADETLVIVKTLICPLQNDSFLFLFLYTVFIRVVFFQMNLLYKFLICINSLHQTKIVQCILLLLVLLVQCILLLLVP